MIHPQPRAGFLLLSAVSEATQRDTVLPNLQKLANVVIQEKSHLEAKKLESSGDTEST